MRRPAEDDDRPRLLVLGCGFGGYSLLARLPRKAFAVTVVSPRNYFLFTPLLPSAVSGSVELRSILEPVRRRLREVRLIEAAAESVDFERRRITCRGAVGGESFSLAWERLVLAVGARVSDYGVPGVDEHALMLASVDDARRLRRGVLERFASAEIPGLPGEEVRRRLRFVICGGGPTGVEVAAEIHDLLAGELRRSNPELASQAQVVVVEAAPRLLGGFDEALSDFARSNFQREGVEVLLGDPVRRIGQRHVELASGRSLAWGLVVWAGGNAMVPLVERLGLPTGPGGRIEVDARLRVPGREAVYALGDCAVSRTAPLPATAQVAQQQGRYLARALRAELRGRTIGEFSFRRLGMLAYVGGGRALADLPHVKWSGRGAWLFWRSVYLTRLVSLSNKVKVLFDWVKGKLLGRDLSRF